MKKGTLSSAARSLDALSRKLQSIKSLLEQLTQEVEHAESCCQDIGLYINAVYLNVELYLDLTRPKDSPD